MKDFESRRVWLRLTIRLCLIRPRVSSTEKNVRNSTSCFSGCAERRLQSAAKALMGSVPAAALLWPLAPSCWPPVAGKARRLDSRVRACTSDRRNRPARPLVRWRSAALDRVEILQDELGRVSQLLTPGSSLILSDYELSTETGDDTDFIVVMP